MKPQKLLMVLGVSILIYYVARQVQIRNNYVENLTEDRILSEAEVQEIRKYYQSLRENKPADPSKLSNKAKVFVNTATAHPFTVVTDSMIEIFGKNSPGGMNRAGANEFIITYTVDFIKNYQHKHQKSNSNLTKDMFVKEAEELIKANKMYMFNIENTQFIIDQNFGQYPGFVQDMFKKIYGPMRDVNIALWGNPVIIKNPDGTQRINMSGPLQTILIDLTYDYLYPNQDIFTWILSLFSGKN